MVFTVVRENALSFVAIDILRTLKGVSEGVSVEHDSFNRRQATS